MKFFINLSLYLLFASIFLLEGFLAEGNAGSGLHLIPSKVSYMIEILSGAIALYSFIILAFSKDFSIRLVYVFFFFALVMNALIGIAFNTVPSGAVFAGMRRYFAFMPLFFLPLVYKFSEKEIKTHLTIILFFGLLQLPLTVYQRFFLFRGVGTGDCITGTLSISSILSIYLICSIAILTAFYIKQKIPLSLFIILSIILFIPTTLNETKGTLVLFPIAIMITILFGRGAIISFKKIFLIVSAVTVIILVFIPIYNYLSPHETDIVNFFKGKGEKTHSVEGYLFKGVSEEELGETELGRFDALLFPFKILSKEPFSLAVGLGIGNVNSSGIKLFEGEHTEYDLYGANSITAASLIWETGLLGLFLHGLFLFLVLKDAIAIRDVDTIIGNLAAGWIAVTIILGLSFFYKNIFHIKVISYLFWYFSGHIAAMRTRHAATMHSNIPHQS